jgi:hypothetical protein
MAGGGRRTGPGRVSSRQQCAGTRARAARSRSWRWRPGASVRTGAIQAVQRAPNSAPDGRAVRRHRGFSSCHAVIGVDDDRRIRPGSADSVLHFAQPLQPVALTFMPGAGRSGRRMRNACRASTSKRRSASTSRFPVRSPSSSTGRFCNCGYAWHPPGIPEDRHPATG